MYHPHATPAVLVRLPNEIGQGLSRVFPAHSVQINLPLQTPAAASQLSHDIGAQTGSFVTQGLVRIEQGFNVEFVGQGLAHHSLLVALLLHR